VSASQRASFPAAPPQRRSAEGTRTALRSAARRRRRRRPRRQRRTLAHAHAPLPFALFLSCLRRSAQGRARLLCCAPLLLCLAGDFRATPAPAKTPEGATASERRDRDAWVQVAPVPLLPSACVPPLCFCFPLLREGKPAARPFAVCASAAAGFKIARESKQGGKQRALTYPII
jgi:hypothetical protein